MCVNVRYAVREIEPVLISGAIVTVTENRVGIRALPLSLPVAIFTAAHSSNIGSSAA